MFASDNIRLIEILENIYYNPVCHLAEYRFFPELTIYGVPSALKDGIVSLYPYHSHLQRFHHGRGLFLLLAVATAFSMLKVPNWERLYILNDLQLIVRSYKYLNICNPPLKMNG